jgi:hypothetical protein
MKYIEKFENFQKENITFEIIDYNVDLESINEKFNYGKYEYDNFDNKGKHITQLTYSQISKLNNIESELNDYLNNINNFEGVYIHNNGAKIKKTFNIILTKHYIEKFLRKDIEDPMGKKGFINPEPHEGIDLIYNNKDILTKYLFSGILVDQDNVLVIMKSSSGYKLIMIIEEDNNKKYNLIFKTQMKGRVTFSKNKSKIIKLSPNP